MGDWSRLVFEPKWTSNLMRSPRNSAEFSFARRQGLKKKVASHQNEVGRITEFGPESEVLFCPLLGRRLALAVPWKPQKALVKM